MSRDPKPVGSGRWQAWSLVPLFHSPRRALAAPHQSSPIPRAAWASPSCFPEKPSACINSRALVLRRLRPGRLVHRPLPGPAASTSTSLNYLEDAKAARLFQFSATVQLQLSHSTHRCFLPPFSPRSTPPRCKLGKNRRGASEPCSEGQ
jgi:hypothetical protein